MTYVIAQPCVDVVDRTCLAECAVEAIYYEDDLSPEWDASLNDSVRSFADPSPAARFQLNLNSGNLADSSFHTQIHAM